MNDFDFGSFESRNKDKIKTSLQRVISSLEIQPPLSLFNQLFPRCIKCGEEVMFNIQTVKSNGVTKSTSMLEDNNDVWFTGLIEASKTVYWEGDVNKGSLPIKYIEVFIYYFIL